MAWLVSITELLKPVCQAPVLPVKGLTASGKFQPSCKFQLKRSVPRFLPLTVNKKLYKFLYRNRHTETLNHENSPLESVCFQLSFGMCVNFLGTKTAWRLSIALPRKTIKILYIRDIFSKFVFKSSFSAEI